MASKNGRSNPSIEDILFDEAYRFDFFQAVRLLELLHPERRPIGRRAGPLEEVVRFRSHLTLAFPASAIHSLEPPDEESPARLTAAFLGLTGPSGVLPRHYTELLLERSRLKDFAFRDFLDIFNHRLLSLFHRAWEKYRFHVEYERALSRDDERDSFSDHLFDLVGMGTKGLRGRVRFGDEALLLYSGLLGQHPRSADALQQILSDYFQKPIAVIQFVGQWLEITEENRTRLGANNELGVSAVAGTRVWDQQAKFMLRVGPLNYAEFERFLPQGNAFQPLVEFTRYCSGQEFDFDVQLVLKAPEVPWCRLGSSELGYTSWLKTREFVRDADQVVFSGGLTRLGALPG
jgi:type VI secretion system protein ImpH